MSTFWAYLNYGINKMSETRQFGTKPETGQILSEKIFSGKLIDFDYKFDGILIFWLDIANIANLNIWSHQIMEKETNNRVIL